MDRKLDMHTCDFLKIYMLCSRYLGAVDKIISFRGDRTIAIRTKQSATINRTTFNTHQFRNKNEQLFVFCTFYVVYEYVCVYESNEIKAGR